MQAEIITIGDEILIGQIVDTNSAFIARELGKIGVSVFQITSIQDQAGHILQALEEAESRADIVITTGGLGPTKDDVTKHTLCKYLDDELVTDPEVLEHIEDLFRKHISTPISDLNRQQALVPRRAEVLHNRYGTAPGLWMQGKKAVLVSLPGVPFEMKELVREQVVPRIVKSCTLPVLLHRTLVTYGLGESAIAERIEAWEDALPPHMKLAYLPNLGKVRLRVSTRGTDLGALEAELESQLATLKPQLADILFGEEDGESLEATIGKLLSARGLSLATAESFTGGRIASQITSVPGASAYFRGSVVAYATELKSTLLGVPESLIADQSVVSAAVAGAMADGVRRLTGADYALATTGNAGPTKGDSDAPIGSAYIAVSGPDGTRTEYFTLGNHRERIVQKAVHKAFEMLHEQILKF